MLTMYAGKLRHPRGERTVRGSRRPPKVSYNKTDDEEEVEQNDDDNEGMEDLVPIEVEDDKPAPVCGRARIIR